MKLDQPLILKDTTESFLITTASFFVEEEGYYYVGTNNEQTVLHYHKKAEEYGESIFLDSTVNEIGAIQNLIDLLIDGMGAKVDVKPYLYHLATCEYYDIIIGHSEVGAMISLVVPEEIEEFTSISLPYNKTGLDTATALLRVLKENTL